YLNFSQYLIIFAANLPEEVTWYLKRISGGWEWVALSLLVLHFALPFVLLMSEDVRGNPRLLWRVALFILFMHFVDLLWLVKPAFSHSLEGHFSIHWMDITALIGVGGIWLALFLWQLKQQPIIPALALPVLHERAHSH
nr:hypothetical protein [Ardenticatenales bacterium]